MAGERRKRPRFDRKSPSGKPPGPCVVHERLPSVVCTDAEHFKAVLQALTGCPKTRAAAAATLPLHLLRQVMAAVKEQTADSPTNSSTTESSPPDSVSTELSVGDSDDAVHSSTEAPADARRRWFLPPSWAQWVSSSNSQFSDFTALWNFAKLWDSNRRFLRTFFDFVHFEWMNASFHDQDSWSSQTIDCVCVFFSSCVMLLSENYEYPLNSLLFSLNISSFSVLVYFKLWIMMMFLFSKSVPILFLFKKCSIRVSIEYESVDNL